MSSLRHLRYMIRHKWFVFLACCRFGIPWLGIIHDWSKFRPSEWLPYSEFFYGPQPRVTGSPAFDSALVLHLKRNKHHWQWWVLPVEAGIVNVLPMPNRYIREMVADWWGAWKAQRGLDVQAWYEKNSIRLVLDPGTRTAVEDLLRKVKR